MIIVDLITQAYRNYSAFRSPTQKHSRNMYPFSMMHTEGRISICFFFPSHGQTVGLFSTCKNTTYFIPLCMFSWKWWILIDCWSADTYTQEAGRCFSNVAGPPGPVAQRVVACVECSGLLNSFINRVIEDDVMVKPMKLINSANQTNLFFLLFLFRGSGEQIDSIPPLVDLEAINAP